MQIRIKFFMDYVCEWCYLGYGILKDLRKAYDFDLELYPIEIHPDIPENGMPMIWHVHNKKKWTDQLNQLGEPYGIHFINKETFSNTKNALILGQYAKTTGKMSDYTDCLWDSYMVKGMNISDKTAIYSIGHNAGFGDEQMNTAFEDPIYYAALERNQQYQHSFGTDQVPAFVINEKYIMIGAQSKDTWEQLFQKIKEEQS